MLFNLRKHAAQVYPAAAALAGRGIDPFSSGAWFHGWDVAARQRRGKPPVVAPTVWLLREGWRRAGTIPPPT